MTRLTLALTALLLLAATVTLSPAPAVAQGSWSCTYNFSQGAQGWSLFQPAGALSGGSYVAGDAFLYGTYKRAIYIQSPLLNKTLTSVSFNGSYSAGSLSLGVATAGVWDTSGTTQVSAINSPVTPTLPYSWTGSRSFTAVMIGLVASSQGAATYSGSASISTVVISGTGTAPSPCPQPATPTPTPTQTLTPSPTGGPVVQAQGTLAVLPTYDPASMFLTSTPYPTIAWPTLTPANLTPVPWMGESNIPMTPGGPFDPPDFPDLTNPDLPGVDTPNGFNAINDANIAGFTVYLVDTGISFYRWFAINFPRVIVGARWFILIMMALYGIFFIWRGSRFRPPDAETAEEQYRPGAFWRTFRLQGRGYAISRQRQEARSRRNEKVAERELKKRNLL